MRTQFSDEALAILNAMPLNPTATYRYEHLSGGFVWSDELPRGWTSDCEAVWEGDLYRYLIHFRAQITLGKQDLGEHPLWRQLETHAPNWPGLVPERRSARMRKRLLAAERLADRCYRKMFDEGECDL